MAEGGDIQLKERWCMAKIDKPENVVNADNRKREFFDFYRRRRPEYFSDSEVRYEVPLTSELFDLQLSMLSTNKKHSQFERFVVALVRRLITPNIKPQTGPDGGGDGKVDAETYEVSDDIADKWYAEEGGAHGRERWAFTISCKSGWKEKIKSDVKKVVETKRGYSRILCFTSRAAKSDIRFALEESLSKDYGVSVKVFDLSWCRDAVFQNGCLDVALSELGFSDEYKRKETRVGSRDARRQERLAEIERSILRKIDGLDTGYIDDLAEACLLSRALGKPRQEVDGRFDRALRECEHHGTAAQEFNLIYNHAWTSLFWFEDCGRAFEDYKKLKPYVEEDCSVVRLEKLTNLLSILTSAVRMGVANLDISQEESFIKQIGEKVSGDSTRQSCALFLKLLQAEQRLLAEARDEESLKDLIGVLKPLMMSASKNLEIGFETHYDIMKELSGRFAGSTTFEGYLDELTEIIACNHSEASAALVRLDRAQSHFNGGRWKDAIKQLSFCLKGFGQEAHVEELIHSLILMGLSLWALRLPYSAEAHLVNAAFLMVKRIRSGGVIEHRLITVLGILCEIELLNGRLVMYLNWRRLLHMLAQNANYDQDKVFVERMWMHDCCWACRFAASDLNQTVFARIPDVLDRNGMGLAADQLKYMLGYVDGFDEQARDTLSQWRDSSLEQPVFEQFIGDIDIAEAGVVRLQTTVKNFTFHVEYVNGCALQEVAELILASMESVMAICNDEELVPRSSVIKIELVETEGTTELNAQLADNEYQLRFNSKLWSAESLWECFARLVAYVLGRNAACHDDVSKWFNAKIVGGRMLEGVSVLLSTHNSMMGVLGEKFPNKIEDWINSSDKTYAPQSRVDVPSRKEYQNKEQRTMYIRTVSRYNGAWEAAGWLGCFFDSRNVYEPPVFALAFENVDKVAPVIDEWYERMNQSEDPIKVCIVRGIDAKHPFWYRLGIMPGNLIGKAVPGCRMMTECKRHTLTPATHDHLNGFEAAYKQFGCCQLTACQVKKQPGAMPEKFTRKFRFSEVEFREAWTIGIKEEACCILGPEDNPVIPEGHETDAPVLAVLEMHRRFSTK